MLILVSNMGYVDSFPARRQSLHGQHYAGRGARFAADKPGATQAMPAPGWHPGNQRQTPRAARPTPTVSLVADTRYPRMAGHAVPECFLASYWWSSGTLSMSSASGVSSEYPIPRHECLQHVRDERQGINLFSIRLRMHCRVAFEVGLQTSWTDERHFQVLGFRQGAEAQLVRVHCGFLCRLKKG